MKTKSVTLIILMLAFLSIFSVNVHFLRSIDGKLEQFHFYKSGLDTEEIYDEEKNSACEQPSDTSFNSLSENLAWFMFSTKVAFVILQPV